MNLKKINNPFGGKILYVESTTSTMTEAGKLLEDKDIHGSIFLTDFQTDGVGRLPGREWLSSPNSNLTFTLILNKDFIGKGFGTTPLRVGLALSKVIKELTSCDANVKWPNDVVVDGKKISGVLCQLSKGYILVGVGVNVNQQEFDQGLGNKPTSISLLSNRGYSLEMVLSNFLTSFYEVLKSDSWLDELNSILYRKGVNVSFAIGNPSSKNIVSGELVGLDDQGKVIIRDRDNIENSYLSGEFI